MVLWWLTRHFTTPPPQVLTAQLAFHHESGGLYWDAAQLFDKCIEELREMGVEPTHIAVQVRLLLACLKHCALLGMMTTMRELRIQHGGAVPELRTTTQVIRTQWRRSCSRPRPWRSSLRLGRHVPSCRAINYNQTNPVLLIYALL